MDKDKKQEEILEKYTDKKKRNRKLTAAYIVKRVSELMLKRIECCSNFITFYANEDLTKKKSANANRCGFRFCPICSWIQAKKDAIKIGVLMRYIEIEHGKTFIFLTLTVPNVSSDKLGETITEMNKAYKKMFSRKDIQAMNKGYIRKLEVTYNNEEYITKSIWYGNGKHKKSLAGYFTSLGLKIGDKNPNYNTYHPHFHVVMIVNKSYFKSRDYIKQKKWLEYWQEAMNNPNITQVRVNQVKDEIKENDYDKDKDKDSGNIKKSSVINEIAKYAAKDDDYMYNKEVFDTFYDSLKSRQLITYNGLFKDAVKLFKAKKLDKYKDKDTTEYIYYLLYKWEKGEYVEEELRLLTDEEREKINNQLIEEIETED